MQKTTKTPLTAKLDRLNRLYRDYSRATERVARAAQTDVDDPTFAKLTAEAKRLSREFDALRSEMPEVKFDMVEGAYFYAAAPDGLENYAVQVTRTDAWTVRLAARTAGEAEDKAKMLIAEQERVPLARLEAEDVSR